MNRLCVEWGHAYTPFDVKDVPKAWGYRWSGGGDGLPKATRTSVAEPRFLGWEMYLREVELQRDVLTAYGRYRPA